MLQQSKLLRITSRVTPVTLRVMLKHTTSYTGFTLRAITITSMATTGYILHRVTWLNRMVFIVTRLLELI